MTSRQVPVWFGALLSAGFCLSPATAAAQRRPTVSDVQVTPPDAQVQMGRTAPFVATAYDNANNPISTATFVWASSNPRAATIDQNGIATGVGPGITIITARAGTGSRAKSGQATLQVTAEGAMPQPQAQPGGAAPRAGTGARLTGPGCAAADRQPAGSGPAVGLLVEPLRVSLVKGEAKPLSYRALQGNGDPADRVCVQFSIEPGGERVAMVDTFGVIVAGGDTGRAVVRIVVPGKATWPPRQITVEVRGDSVRFQARELSMAPGTVDTLQMLVPAQGNRVINPVGIFQFQSSDTSKVRVSPVAPIVTAVAPGSSRIVAQSSVYPDLPITIDVHRRVARLVGTPSDTLVMLAIGGTAPVGVRPQAPDSSLIAEVPLRWAVEDSTVARYDTAAKVLRGLRMGETRLTVTAPVAHDTVIFRHWHAKVVAGGLLVSRPRVGLGVGERVPIAVQLLDDRRQPIGPATQLAWTSSSDSVARVVDGQIVGVGMGHARLTARSPWDSTVTTEVYVVGDVLFSALRAGQWDLYMAHGENGQPNKVRPLTNDSALESQPAWSPTLQQIAYVAAPSPAASVFDLYIANADGSEPRRLTNDSGLVRSPSFVRPAGDQIVFESSRGGKPQLYIVNRDGSGRRELTRGDNPNSQPNASPDGRRLLFVSLRETAPRERSYDVYEMNLDGTGERRLTTSPRPEDSPAYAADGRSFFYLRDEGGTPQTKRVYRQDLTSGEASPITPMNIFVQGFSVSADGSTLALTILQADASGAQTSHVALFAMATGAMTPVPPAGVDRLANPTFRPATPR